MADNFDMNRGVTKVVPATTGIKSGDPVVVGALMGVALTDEVGGFATVGLEGVFYDESLASATIHPGTVIYTSTAAGANNIAVKATLTTTVGTNEVFGIALNSRTAKGITEIKVG